MVERNDEKTQLTKTDGGTGWSVDLNLRSRDDLRLYYYSVGFLRYNS